MTVALGNPLLLATDFNPTATFGMVSGVHRYQKIPHPTGTLLEYCDCIQVDTAINPGNSGGPLFNMKGEWIGINSAGSLGKSDRINSGAAYSISVNMVKNFLGQLRAGLECDHATLGAEVDPENEDGGLGDLIVSRIVSGSEVDRRGLSPGDELVAFGGLPMRNINQFKNRARHLPQGLARADGLPPRRDGGPRRAGAAARPDGRRDRRTRAEAIDGPAAGPAEPTGPPPLPPPPAGTRGRQALRRQGRLRQLLFQQAGARQSAGRLPPHGRLQRPPGPWTMKADCTIAKKTSSAEVSVRPPAKDQKNEQIAATVDGIDYALDPFSTDPMDTKLENLMRPKDSGGLLLALYQYRQLLTQGEKGFIGEYVHGGVEPFYPPSVVGSPPDYRKRVMCDVLRTKQAGVSAKWYFRRTDEDKWYMPQAPTGELIGFEVTVDHDEDPCEVYLSDYRSRRAGRCQAAWKCATRTRPTRC